MLNNDFLFLHHDDASSGTTFVYSIATVFLCNRISILTCSFNCQKISTAHVKIRVVRGYHQNSCTTHVKIRAVPYSKYVLNICSYKYTNWL